MSLLDDLRAAAQALDPQFAPSSNEVQGVLGALVHYAEHGEEFLKAAEAGSEDVVKLLQPHTDEPGSPEPAPAAVAEPVSDQELDAQIADLQAQRDARRATSQASQVTHETGVGGVPPAPPSKPGGWLHRS